MRLTLIISLIGIYQAYCYSTYSQSTKLSLQMENSRVKDVLASIEEQSEFYFLYSSKLVDVEKSVTVKASNSRIEEILTCDFQRIRCGVSGHGQADYPQPKGYV
jgi:TonB-dependent starch-binding outer membrane protein SusC